MFGRDYDKSWYVMAASPDRRPYEPWKQSTNPDLQFPVRPVLPLPKYPIEKPSQEYEPYFQWFFYYLILGEKIFVTFTN